jgi:hypothetical protein
VLLLVPGIGVVGGPTIIGLGVGVAATTGFGVGTGVGGKLLVTTTLLEGVGVAPTIRARVGVESVWLGWENKLVVKTSRNANTDKYFIGVFLWGEQLLVTISK